MMPEGFKAEYRDALRRPHRSIYRVEVWNGTVPVADNLRVIDGQVECSLGSQVTRRASLTLDPRYYPSGPDDVLAPYGNRINIYRGIESNDREFWFQIFHGRISKVERKPRQPMTLTAVDRAAEVEENEFEAAEESLPYNTLTEEIIRLIREGVPGAQFTAYDHLAGTAGAQVFTDSRASACDQLADSGGAFWYALADGRFTIRRVPWAYQADGVDTQPVVTYDEYGTGPFGSGTISDWTMSMSRENLYNIVVGTADQPDGGEPRRDVVRDTNAESPTYIGGKFGKRVLKAAFPSASSAGVVRDGAAALLRRSRAAADATTWEMVPDCSLELGDVVELAFQDQRLVRTVSDMTIPITAEGSMQCSGRPIVLPDGTVIDAIDKY